MAVFGGMTLTNKGLVLQGKAQAGIQLNYTRIGIGDGSLSGQSVPALNALISPKKSLPVARLQMQPPNKVIIGTTLSNADVTTGFYFREVGVFAQDPDAGEILYAYANAGVTADYIAPGGGTDIIEKAFDCVVVVGTAVNITASIDDSLIFALQKDLDTVSASKVDKISGKGLSANDYTTAEKNKLAGITAGAGGAGSASDAVIGNRTISDTTAPAGDTGAITSLFGGLANMIKSITGKSSWRTAPVTTLEAAKAHADDAVRHLTAAERTAWNAKETTAGAQAKADAAQVAAATDATTKANVAQAAAATDAAAKANTVQANVTSHTANTTVHITAGERTAWNAKASMTTATTSIPGLMAAADKAKLDGVAAGSNNYTHPAAHPPSIIVQDANNRFVTDAEKNTWNAKASTATVTASTAGLMSAADKTLLNNNTGFGTTSGIATAYTVTLSPAPTALVPGLKFSFRSHVASGDNPTLNPNALGAKPIKKPNGNAATLALNGVYTVVYDGTAFQLQGEGGEYGTATAADVRKGATIGTENGVMPGALSLSPPGIDWTFRTIPFESSGSSVCYGNGLFVSVSFAGEVLSSPDGITWTHQADIGNLWVDVCYENGMFVALGSSKVAISVDGLVWKIVNTPEEMSDMTSICYGNGLFVASRSVSSFSSRYAFMTSPDGIAWTLRYEDQRSIVTSICYGNGLFVAVCRQSLINQFVLTSPDGINWTYRNGPDASWQSVCYGNGLFVAVGDTTGKSIMTSRDGITWTVRSGPLKRPSSVCYGNGLFVAVDTYEDQVMTSPNGFTWTLRDKPTVPNTDFRIWYSICYGKGRFVAVGGQSYVLSSGSDESINNYIVPMDKFKEDISNALVEVGSRSSTSMDTNALFINNIRAFPMIRAGAMWVTRSIALTTFWKSVCYGKEMFVAVGNGSTGAVMTSSDGINWTARSGAQSNDWRSVCYGNGVFVAVGSGIIMTSPDGINWVSRTAANINTTWRSVTYGNGLFVAMGSPYGNNVHTGNVMTSPDGINWTMRITNIVDEAWCSVCYGNGIFVAINYTNGDFGAMISEDGISWMNSYTQSESSINWKSVCYGNGIFVAVGPEIIMTSDDGIGWRLRQTGINNRWESVCYGNGLFVVVCKAGNDSCVMTSPDGINWTARSGASNKDWLSVCYGNGTFVAVSDESVTMDSHIVY